MIPNFSREYTQAISAAFIITGIFLMVLTPATTLYGVAAIGFSCWILMMSESILHAKVQTEMSSALECLRRKQETEIQDLLYFLRESKLAANPLQSWDAAAPCPGPGPAAGTAPSSA